MVHSALKMESPISFVSLKQLKPKLRVFSIEYIVAMVASKFKKVTKICSPMIGHLMQIDTLNERSTDKNL